MLYIDTPLSYINMLGCVKADFRLSWKSLPLNVGLLTGGVANAVSSGKNIEPGSTFDELQVQSMANQKLPSW